MVQTNVRDAQAKSRTSKAEHDLPLVEKAIAAMNLDLTKWPNGCMENVVLNPEANIESAEAELTQAPPVGNIDTDCEWFASGVANWDGPHIQDASITDPLGNSYIFDPDYCPWQSCSSETTLPVTAPVVTFGPDGTRYTYDDVYRDIIR